MLLYELQVVVASTLFVLHRQGFLPAGNDSCLQARILCRQKSFAGAILAYRQESGKDSFALGFSLLTQGAQTHVDNFFVLTLV